MFGIGGTELIIILVFGLLIFGPDKMPQMGRTIGRALRQFQQAQDDMTRVLKAELYSKDDAENALKMPDLEGFLTRKSEATQAKETAKAAKIAAKAPVAEAAEAVTSPEASASLAASLYGLPPEVEPQVDEPEAGTEAPEPIDIPADTTGEEVGEEA